MDRRDESCQYFDLQAGGSRQPQRFLPRVPCQSEPVANTDCHRATAHIVFPEPLPYRFGQEPNKRAGVITSDDIVGSCESIAVAAYFAVNVVGVGIINLDRAYILALSKAS